MNIQMIEPTLDKMDYIELDTTEETVRSDSPVGQFNINNRTRLIHDVDILVYLEPQKQISSRLQISLMLCVMVTAIAANSLMCYAIRKTPNQRIITNILTMNLGVSDLGVAVFAMPLMIGIIGSGATISSSFCNFTMFITVALLLVQAATLAAISLDRYFSICHPLRYPMEMTGRRGQLVVVVVWIESIVLASTPLFGWGEYFSMPQSIPMCLPRWTNNTTHAIFMLMVGLGMPFGCMIFSYTCIIQEARKQSKRIEKLHLTPSSDALCISDDKAHLVPHGRRLSVLASKWRRPSTNNNTIHYSASSRNIKTLKTVFIIVGAFVICWFPYVVGCMWGSIIYPSRIPASFELSTVLLIYSSCAISPFVFTLLTRDIRHTVYHVILRIVCLNPSSGGLCGPYCERRGSGVETIRLHSRESRGSMDSGVDVETGFPHVPHTQQLRPYHFHDNDAYEKSSCSDNDSNLLAPPVITMAPGQMPRLHRSSKDDSNKCSNMCDTLKTKTNNLKPIFHNIPTIVVLGQTE